MLDQENSTATVDTDTSTETNSQVSKTFTQDELNAILAKTKSQLEKKLTSKYADLGEPDELRDIVTNYRKQQQDLDLKKGNFEKIVSELNAKTAAEIAKRDNIIREFKLEQPLMNYAAQYRSVNPEQVKQLLRNNLRLNEDGEVEVLDAKGAVRYSDKGKVLSVEQYVQEWLTSNPHFVSAAPSTTNTSGGVRDNSPGPIDLNNLDMTRTDHRKLYADARRNGKL